MSLDIYFVNLIRKFYSEKFYSTQDSLNPIKSDKVISKKIITEQVSSKQFNKLKSNQNKKILNKDWEIIIPKIKLQANIREGTSSTVINKSVGHFENTSLLEGNVVLAAHNRGKNCNYFQRINELERGDEIYYKINESSKKYKVEENNIIRETDLTCLKPTNQNIITLVTCVKDMPNFRRCVQAVEI